MSKPIFELFKDSNGNFNFVFKDSNGSVILTGVKECDNKKECEYLINNVLLNGDRKKSFKKLNNTNGEYYFNIMSPITNDVLGESNSYINQTERDKGIDFMIDNIRSIPEEDIEENKYILD